MSQTQNKPSKSLPIFLFAVGVVILIGMMWRLDALHDTAPVPVGTGEPSIGGDFTLTNHHGETVTSATYDGKFRLMYFGYTFCPDICPTSLGTMGAALDMLPPEVMDQVAPLFVTIDPERDTQALIADYATAFHDDLVGLRGTPEQTEAVAATFRVPYRKVEEGDGPYLMDHGSIVYLMGPAGKYVDHFGHGMPPADMAAGIRRAVEKAS